MDFMIGDLLILKAPDSTETRVIFRGYLPSGMAVVFDPVSESIIDAVSPELLSQLPPAEFHYSTASEHGDITEHRTGDWA